MELNVSKHPDVEEISLSTDVFKFLQRDHNLLSQNKNKKCFCCEVCMKSFLDENDLHYHRLDHIIEKPLFICDDLVEDSVSDNYVPSEFNEEYQSYNKIFTCARCNKHFQTISCLRVHQKFFHFGCVPTSSCDQCGSHFKWKHHLAVHKYSESREKTSFCNTCNINAREESYASNKSYAKTSVAKKDLDAKNDLPDTHQKFNAQINKKHVCRFCQKEFTLKGNLSRHILLIHNKERMFASEKKYSKKIKVKTHIEIRSKKIPFICNICQKAFTHKGYLNRHLRFHSEGKLFCSICHAVFGNSTSLEQHSSTHFEKKLFVCQTCLKSFKYQNDLDCHIQALSHGKPLSCEFCKKRFIRKRCLITHTMRFHSDQRQG